MGEQMQVIARALARLDTRGHAASARLEIFHDSEGGVVALILADPLPVGLGAQAATLHEAIRLLAREVEGIDWRKVKR